MTDDEWNSTMNLSCGKFAMHQNVSVWYGLIDVYIIYNLFGCLILLANYYLCFGLVFAKICFDISFAFEILEAPPFYHSMTR